MLTSAEEALEGNVLLYEEWEDNVYCHRTASFGDVEGAFHAADRIFDETFYMQRQAPLPVELRGCVASYDGFSLSLWFAKQAEASGFARLWIPEIIFNDAFVPGTAAAMSTEHIEIGTGVVGIWSRSPVVMALEANTLHEISSERMVLGLGTQARGYVNYWHGRTYERPLLAMREFISIVRSIVDLEETTYDGDVFSVHGFQLIAQPSQRRLLIHMAAIGPKMIQLAGELADSLLGYFYSLEYLREVVIPNLEIGAERSGRSLDDFDIGVGLPANVGDAEKSVDELRGQVVMFVTALGSSPAYATSIEMAGFGEEASRIRRLVEQSDMEGALSVVTPEMIDALTISGTPGNARKRVEEYATAGATSVVLNPAAPNGYYPLYGGHLDGVELPEFDFGGYVDVIETTIKAMAD